MTVQTTADTLNDSRLAFSPGGWLTFCEDQPQLKGAPASELLARGERELAGNLRYALGGDGPTLLAETPVASWQQSLDEGARRLLSLVESSPKARSKLDLPEEDLVESALAESGMSWTRRETNWAAQPYRAKYGEIVIDRQPGEAVCQIILAQWEESPPGVVLAALAEFFCRAHAGQRLVRGSLSPEAACLTSRVTSEELEDGVADHLAALSTAGRLLVDETQALLCPAMARRYLDHLGCPAPEDAAKSDESETL